jgi:hypothetical protein
VAAALATLLASAASLSAAHAAPTPSPPAAPKGQPLAAGPDQQTADEAERLFRQAKPLLDAGRYEEACPKLERSQALDPALGTEFNLADCLEHTGQAARAYQLFGDVAALARASGRTERERSARERQGKLEGQIGHILLSVESLAALPDAVLQRDGEELPREAWGRPLVVASGRHTFSVSAPRHEPWTAPIEVGARARVELRVPALKPVATPARSRSTGAPPADPYNPEPGSTHRTLAYVAAGVGVAGIAVGTTFGALSLVRKGRASEGCPEQTQCADERSAQEWTRATSAGHVSTLGFVAGSLGLGGAALIWLSAPKRSITTTAALQGLRVTPPIGHAPLYVAWRATF